MVSTTVKLLFKYVYNKFIEENENCPVLKIFTHNENIILDYEFRILLYSTRLSIFSENSRGCFYSF